MEKSVLQRIRDVIEFYNISDRKFAESIGLPQTTISSLFKRGNEPNITVVQSIVNAFADISLNWLITGEGPMLKEEAANSLSAAQKIPDNYRLVPLYNLDAVGGMHATNLETADSEYVEEYVPFEAARKGDVSLWVTGESMIPTYPPGCKILIRRVVGWQEYFGFGNVFVLLLNDGRRILKEVVKSEENPKTHVLCKSHNPKYSPEELPKNMIGEVWKVIQAHINRGW